MDPADFRKQWKALAGLLLLLMGGLMMFAPFTIEDAYITFRYSRNVAEGLGPVYNPGEYVEGYTAPLWMALMVVPHILGLNIELFSGALGILCSILTAVLWLHMLGKHFPGRGLAFFLALVIGSQSTLLAFSYSGMETSQNLLVITLLLHQLIRVSGGAPGQKDRVAIGWAWAGLLGFLCLFSRPDNAVLLFVAAIVGAWEWKSGRLDADFRKIGTALLVFLPLIAAYLLWKISFYGDLLPNTFYAKGTGFLRQGLQYLALFTLSSGLPLAWLVGAFGLRKSMDSPLSRFSLLFPPVWMLYILYVGGDFMEFRMMVPAIPFMIFAAVKGMSGWTGKRFVPWAAGSACVAANIFLSLGFNHVYPTGFVVSASGLAAETGHPGCGNIVQGKKLNALFGGEKDFRIASGGAGAMPYYARTYLLDMVGLTDSEVGRKGLFTGGIPGHRRFAEFRTLKNRHIHLVVGTWHLQHDHSTTCSSTAPELLGMLGLSSSLPVGVRLVSMPLVDGWEQRMAYLETHPAVEQALLAGKLREIQLQH